MVDGVSVLIPPQATVPFTGSITTLRAVDSDAQQDGQPYAVRSVDNIYLWNAASVAVDDGSLYIRPDDRTSLQAGRWIIANIGMFSGSGGSANVGFLQAGTGAVERTSEAKMRDAVSVLDFIPAAKHAGIAAGTNTDNLASYFVLALARGTAVYVPAGVYCTGQIELPAGATIFGAGMNNTILRDVNGSEGTNGTTDVYGMFSATSGSYTTTVDNIHISDLQMQGMVASRAFREHRHCINLRGVRNVLIERCKFFGYRGDAVCLSGEIETPTGASSYRHNYNVKILNNVFDGDNSDNRNAVSVVDCAGFDFCFNTVKNSTRTGMPGAVDFEPNAYPLYVFTDLTVAYNRFESVGGSVGVVGIQVPAAVTAVPLRVTIAHNKFVSCRNEIADISLNMARTFANADQSQKIVVTGNSGYGGVRPFVIYSAKGIRLDESNQWEHYDFGGRIGNTGAAPKPYGCVIKPTLKDVGFAGIQVYRGDFLTLGGDYTDSATVALFFDGTAAAGDGTTNVTIRDLKTKAAGTIVVSVATSGNHSVSASTNRFLYDTCELNGLAATFAAQDLRGSVALVAGTATVTMPGVAASSQIFLQRSTNAGTAGDSFAVTRSAGTSFTITSKTANATVAGDTSTVSYRVEPA